MIYTELEISTRKEFEAWLLETHGLDAEWQPERNCYREFPAHLAFRAWVCSREELEITLPKVTYKQNPDIETDIEIRIRNSIREQLEELGIACK